MDRNEVLLRNLRLDGVGLEIGPGLNPLLAGRPAMDVKTLDHLDRDGLTAKYIAMGEDPARIPHIDFVWSGEPYKDLVGSLRFDWILASHVIEHVPDPVAFINECAGILAPGGVLALAVPDKRYTFDFYRAVTSLSSLIDAHLEGRRAPSPGQGFEFAIDSALMDGRFHWSPDEAALPALMNNAKLANTLFNRMKDGEYADIHAWVFTPNGFRRNIEDLNRMGILQLRELSFQDLPSFEFAMHLSAEGTGPGVDRATLGRRALEEGWPPELQPGADPDRISRLEAELASAKARVSALENSTTWRAMAPARWVADRLAGRRGRADPEIP